MSRSLSLILPIANVERTLAENVQELFELLNDLTDQFEILLLDQGSSDHTIDVARELATVYPQVRVAHCDGGDQGGDLMDKTLAETTGDIVFVLSGRDGVRPSALRQLWCLNEQSTSPNRRLDRVGRLPEPPEYIESGNRILANSDTEVGCLLEPLAATAPHPTGGEVSGLRVVRRPIATSRSK